MAHLTLSVSEKRKITRGGTILYAARTSLTVRGRSLGACSLILSPQNLNATDTSHDNLQRVTVRYVHLDFSLIQSQQEVRPFVHVDLCCRDSRIPSITVSSGSVTYFDIFCSWLILLIFPWSANFLLLCTIVHLFNIPRHGMDTFDIDSMLAFLLQVDKSPTFRRFLYLVLNIFKSRGPLFLMRGELEPSEELMFFIRFRCMLCHILAIVQLSIDGSTSWSIPSMACIPGRAGYGYLMLASM